jgi:hypothetical protein
MCRSPVAQYEGAARVVGVVVLLGAYNNKHHFNPSGSSVSGLVAFTGDPLQRNSPNADANVNVGARIRGGIPFYSRCFCHHSYRHTYRLPQ